MTSARLDANQDSLTSRKCLARCLAEETLWAKPHQTRSRRRGIHKHSDVSKTQSTLHQIDTLDDPLGVIRGSSSGDGRCSSELHYVTLRERLRTMMKNGWRIEITPDEVEDTGWGKRGRVGIGPQRIESATFRLFKDDREVFKAKMIPDTEGVILTVKEGFQEFEQALARLNAYDAVARGAGWKS